jgi:hypothetical protein
MDYLLFAMTPIISMILSMPTNMQIQPQSKSITHKIFVDSGGWYIAYYMGVFHYIFTTFGVDIFKGAHFEGVSAGGQIIGYALATIHGCKDMKYWLDNGPKHAISNNNYGYGRLTLGCYNAGKRFYDTLGYYQRETIKQKYCSLGLDSSSLKPFYIRNVSNRLEFACAVASTGNIPIVGSFYTWRYSGKRLWDGYMNLRYNYSNNLDYNADNVLFFSFDKHEPKKNVVYIHLSKWTNFSIFKSVGISFYNKNDALLATDELFENGFADAKLNHDELHRKLHEFGLYYGFPHPV